MTSRLQLHLSARDLRNVAGLLSVSDPFAVVTVRGDSEHNKPRVVGQTDVYVRTTERNEMQYHARTECQKKERNNQEPNSP